MSANNETVEFRAILDEQIPSNILIVFIVVLAVTPATFTTPIPEEFIATV